MRVFYYESPTNSKMWLAQLTQFLFPIRLYYVNPSSFKPILTLTNNISEYFKQKHSTHYLYENLSIQNAFWVLPNKQKRWILEQSIRIFSNSIAIAFIAIKRNIFEHNGKLYLMKPATHSLLTQSKLGWWQWIDYFLF